MAGPRCKSQMFGTLTVKTLVAASLAAIALPALANTVARKTCPSTEIANLSVPADALVTNTVSHDVAVPRSEDSVPPEIAVREFEQNLLTPRAEAAIREAFQEDDADVDDANVIESTLIESVLRAPPIVRAKTDEQINESTESSSETDNGMKTALPGVADDELSQFKKVMFRRDI